MIGALRRLLIHRFYIYRRIAGTGSAISSEYEQLVDITGNPIQVKGRKEKIVAGADTSGNIVPLSDYMIVLLTDKYTTYPEGAGNPIQVELTQGWKLVDTQGNVYYVVNLSVFDYPKHPETHHVELYCNTENVN